MKCLLSDHGALLHGGPGLFKAVILNRDSQESPGMRSCTLQHQQGWSTTQKPPSKQFASVKQLDM